MNTIHRAWSWATDFLCGKDGKLSNPKLMGWAIYLAFLYARPIPVAVVGMLLAASFGYKAWSEWVNKASFTITGGGNADLSAKWEKVEHHVVNEWKDGTEDGVL